MFLLVAGGAKHMIWKRIQKNGSNRLLFMFLSKQFQKIAENDDPRISTKINKWITNRTAWTCRFKICNLFLLISNIQSGSSILSYDIKTFKHDNSFYSQSFQKLHISWWSTMHDLQKAYLNSKNSEIRFLVPWRWQQRFLMILDVFCQNRWTSRLRKMIGEVRLARGRSKWKKSQNSIVEPPLNSHEFEAFLHGFTKTVGEEDMWSTNQEESNNLVEKRWRNLEKCWWRFLKIWEKMEGKFVRFLRIVIIFAIQLWLNIYTPA